MKILNLDLDVTFEITRDFGPTISTTFYLIFSRCEISQQCHRKRMALCITPVVPPGIEILNVPVGPPNGEIHK